MIRPTSHAHGSLAAHAEPRVGRCSRGRGMRRRISEPARPPAAPGAMRVLAARPGLIDEFNPGAPFDSGRSHLRHQPEG